MQFVVIGYDYTDDQALERRLKVRDAHIAMVNEGVKLGHQLFGTAILDENGKMCGSVMLFDFPSREDLNKWIEKDPYIHGKVWERVEVFGCSIPPSFAHLFNK